MTTGDVTIDKRIPTLTPIFGGGANPRCGPVDHKVWRGTDKPKSVVPVKYPTPNFVTYYTFDKRGNRVLKSQRAPSVKPPKRVRLKQMGDHPYAMTFERKDEAMVEVRLNVTGAIAGYGNTSMFGQPTYTSRWSANDDIKLVQKLREKMNGSQFHAGVFLGTGHQTAFQLMDTASRILRAARAVRKFQFSKALDALGLPATKHKSHARSGSSRSERVAQEWLGLQYGWLPLIEDCKTLAQSLAHHVNAPLQTTFRVRRKLDDTGSYKLTGGTQGPGNFREAYLHESGQIIARFTELPSIWKLEGLSDPASVAWELAPWSFVADWFLPIGDWLEARGFASGLEGTFIITRQTKFGMFGKTRVNQSGPYGYYPIGDGSYELVTFNRTVSPSLSVPFPEFVPLKDALSWRRATNAVSLLVTNFRRFGEG